MIVAHILNNTGRTMNRNHALPKLGLLLAVALSSAGLAAPAEAAAVPVQWKNCTVVNKRFPHGLGKATARDRTSGTPVTNFRRDTRLYNVAMSYNKGLDRDKDGIACEKA